jgi:hypothetical protein
MFVTFWTESFLIVGKEVWDIIPSSHVFTFDFSGLFFRDF